MRFGCARSNCNWYLMIVYEIDIFGMGASGMAESVAPIAAPVTHMANPKWSIPHQQHRLEVGRIQGEIQHFQDERVVCPTKGLLRFSRISGYSDLSIPFSERFSHFCVSKLSNLFVIWCVFIKVFPIYFLLFDSVFSFSFFSLLLLFSLYQIFYCCATIRILLLLLWFPFFVPLSSSCFSISFCLTTQHCEEIFLWNKFGVRLPPSWRKTELRGKTLKWFIASSEEGKEKVLHRFFDIFFWEKLRLNWDFLSE